MIRTLMVLISIVSLILLMLSLFNFKNTFELINNTTANLLIKSCTVHGITLLCRASIEIQSALEYSVELTQLKLFDMSNNYIDSWSGEIRNNENFLISFSNVGLFGDKFERFIIEGFVKIKFKIGRNDLKIDLPVKAEVSVIGR